MNDDRFAGLAGRCSARRKGKAWRSGIDGGGSRSDIRAENVRHGLRGQRCFGESEGSDCAKGIGIDMELEIFIDRARALMPLGQVFENLGGGTSRIMTNDEGKVCYKRGNSRIYVRWRDLHSAYMRFAGRRVSSSDLRKAMPSVFDSSARPAGHSCNCTFLFHLLTKLSLTEGGPEGRGVVGDPFAVRLRPAQGA